MSESTTGPRESSSATWTCFGWVEGRAPDDSPHQWMHAYYEIPAGEKCDICGASETSRDRWDGRMESLPREVQEAWPDPYEGLR